MGNSGKSGGGERLRLVLAPLGVLLVGGLATWGAFTFVNQRERVELQLAEQRRAADATSAIFLALQVPVEAALTLPAFLGASGQVSHDEFAAFATALLERHSSLKKLQWAARVPHTERAAFESTWGIPIREPNDAGRMVVAAERSEYYPILFIAPETPGVVGLDVTFDDGRRHMIDYAVSVGRATLSPRFRLIEDPPDVYSVAVNAPLRRAGVNGDEVVGLGAAIFRPQVVVEEAVAALNLDGLRFTLVDTSSDNHDVVFAYPPESVMTWSARVHAAQQYNRDFNYLDRRWTIQWRWDAPTGKTAWIVLGLGGVVTLLAVGVVALRNMMLNLRNEMFAAQRLGNYRLERKLGQGGMGTVYLAHHAFLRRPTAIKVIRPDPDSPELFKRFEREAQYTSRLTHPNTISIFDFGETNRGVFYYAMEYVQGVTLRELVRACGPLPLARVQYIMAQVAGSLAEAHSHGILHRDIKPENVMVCAMGGIPDFVKVLDFGLVKDASKTLDSGLSARVALLGTPGYIAPEAITNPTAFTPASDVYSMGALLYFLVTGRRVHQANSRVQVLKLALETEPVNPSLHLEEGLPAPWEAFILRCLHRDPQRRSSDAGEFRRELGALKCPTRYSETEAKEWWASRGAAILQKVTEGLGTLDTAPTDLAPARSSVVQSRGPGIGRKKRTVARPFDRDVS
jgi:serine/threonine protein kinase/CHASE1-domain containing sensor protein